jgi:hypothetical protein
MGPADRSAFAKSVARKLGVAVATLLPNQEEQQKAEQPRSVTPSLIPWDHKVDGKELLKELEALVCKHIYISPDYALAAVLWCIWTYLVSENFVTKAPHLGITGASWRVGKTRLLDLLELLVWKAFGVGRLSEAALYRLIAQEAPTLLMDEFHKLLLKYPNLLDLMLTAYDRGKKVVLFNSETHAIDQFSCWSAKAITFLGSLDPQLRDRIIEIFLERKPKGEKRAKLRETPVEVFEILRRKILRWVTDNLDKIKAFKTVDLDVGNDRATDNWEFLLAIANAIGKECFDRAFRIAVKHESEGYDDDTVGPSVLKGLRDIFKDKCDDLGRNFDDPKIDLVLPLTYLCDELNKDELAPWADHVTPSGAKGITPHKLSKVLGKSGYRVGKPNRERTEQSLDPTVAQYQKSAVRSYSLSQLRPHFRNIEEEKGEEYA